MPVVGIPLDELHRALGREIAPDVLEHELHRFGASVEGWTDIRRWRCPQCDALSEAGAEEPAPATCEACGADFRDPRTAPAKAGDVKVLKMELLAVRPDLFGATGLARGLRGFLGHASGAPDYAVRDAGAAEWRVDVDAALDGPDVHRPRISAAIVRGVSFDEARLRALMKLQENLHWALGRDRKLASIGVYDLAQVKGPKLSYRAVGRTELRFVPLGFDAAARDSALNPDEILARHPKGKAFAWLLAGSRKVPLLEDSAGGVLSMPPIINSEATRVTTATTAVFIDVTGLEDRLVDRALNIVVTSLLEACPAAVAERVAVGYAAEERRTPDFTPQQVVLDPAAASRVIGVEWTRDQVLELLRRMRHDATAEGDKIRVFVPAWRADILHPRDLMEDAAIAYGYDNIGHAALTTATFGAAEARAEGSVRARRVLTGLGLLEVLTLPLTSEDATYEKTGLADTGRQVRCELPISVEQTMLRTSLIPGLMETLAVNAGHAYPQRIFEVGLVSEVDQAAETGAAESLEAAVALAGDGFGYADIRALLDAFTAEIAPGLTPDLVFRRSELPLFIPGRGAELWRGDIWVGRVGEVHPRILHNYRVVHPVAVLELKLDALG